MNLTPNEFFLRIMNLNAIHRQSILSLISQIFITLTGFVGTMYFAHALGASILGAYFLLLTYNGIIGMISDGGFGMAAIKRISEGEEQREYLSAYFFIRLILMVITIILLIIFRRYLAGINNSGLFNWLILLSIITGITGFIGIGVSGTRKMGIVSTSNFLGEFFKTVVQITGVYLGYGLMGMAGGLVALLIIQVMAQFRFLDLRLVPFKLRHIKGLYAFSFWLFLTSSGMWLYSYSDTVIIGHYLHNTDIGIYRVIFQFSTIGSFVAGPMSSTLWPNVSRWGKIKEIKLIEESLSKAFTFSLLLAIPVLVGGIILGDRLLYHFYGSDFSAGYYVLIVLLIVQIVSIFQSFYLNYLGALDKQRSAFKVTIISAMANILINIILVPTIGIIGAAFATLVTLSINAYLARRLLSQLINIKIEYDIILNIIKSSIAMSIFVILYRLFVTVDNLVLTIIPVIVGGAIYGFLILRLDKKIYNDIKGIVTQIGQKTVINKGDL